jgi:hypothetical protein
MNKHRITALLASVGLVTGLMSTVSIAGASASSHCKVQVTQLRAWDVNDNDGQDEIRFSLDGTTYGTYTFNQGTIRNSSLGTVVKETTASHVAFEIWERDYPLTTTIDSVTLNCGSTEIGSHSIDLVGHSAGYTLNYTVS